MSEKDRSEETRAVIKASLLLSLCLLIAVVALLGAEGTREAENIVLVGCALVWAGIGISGFLIILSPYGWFGFIGKEVNKIMADEETFDRS
jgi:hypothetical protein